MKEIASFLYNDEQIEKITFFQRDEINTENCMQAIMKNSEQALSLYRFVTGFLRVNEGFGTAPLNFQVTKEENSLLFTGDIQKAVQLLTQRKLLSETVLSQLQNDIQSIKELKSDKSEKSKQVVTFWVTELPKNLIKATYTERKQVLDSMYERLLTEQDPKQIAYGILTIGQVFDISPEALQQIQPLKTKEKVT